MTVILGWNSLQNWLACPVHAPLNAPGPCHRVATGWALRPASLNPGLWREQGGRPRSCLCTAALPVLQGPTDPSTGLCSPTHPGTHEHPGCFRHSCPRCHGHTPVTVWVGSTRPWCQNDTRTLQLFGFLWLWSSPMRALPSLCWQWPFLSTSKCHMRQRWDPAWAITTAGVLLSAQGWGNIFATTWSSIKMIKSITNYAKSYQPNKKQRDVLSAESWSANLSSNRNTAEQLILWCLRSIWGSFPNLMCIFVGRGGLVAEQTNQGIFLQVQVHQKFSCEAQQTAQLPHKWYLDVLHPDMWCYGLVPKAAMQSTRSPGLWQELREKCTV